jgi:hypothetical protein
MLTNDEKIEVLIDRISKIDFIAQSFIDHAEQFKDKYSLEDELLSCSYKKNALIGQLELLGGSVETFA